MHTVSWLGWAIAKLALVAVASVVVMWDAFGGGPVAGLVIAGVWVVALATTPIRATLTPTEVVVHAPLRARRIPLPDVALERPEFLPFAKVRRHGKGGASLVPYTRDTERFFAQVENAQW